MKFKDIQIKTQLRLGLGLILVLVTGLGLLALRQADLLWRQAETIYAHSLQTRQAVGALTADVLIVHWAMEELFSADHSSHPEPILDLIEAREADAQKQFDILYDRYLGPRSDIDHVRHRFAACQTNRRAAIGLLQAGDISGARAINIHRDTGPNTAHLNEVRSHLDDLDRFSRRYSDDTFNAATALSRALNRQLMAIISLILGVALMVSWLLFKSIRDPLRHLTAATEQFRHGRTEARSGYVSANEFGRLSTAFDAMAETVETQMRVSDRARQIADVMLREIEARAFCQELIKSIIALTEAQIGAIYLLNPQGTQFEHFESIGLGAGNHAPFSAKLREGEFGAALATGRMQRIGDIPLETRFTFTAVSGNFTPREIITIPLRAGDRTVAVLSLASIRPFDKSAVMLLENIHGTLTARMSGVLAFARIQELAARLETQNSELKTQKEELSAQANELSTMNAELEIQTRQLAEASRLKSAFLSNMSHELRTPLNSVIALSGVLSRRLAGAIPAEEYGYLDIIERNGRHLLTLINNILDLSRIESGREEIDARRFSIRALVAEVADLLAPQAREKGIALHHEVAGDLPEPISDPDKCRHILQNLVGNAVKFTEAGSVEISARQAGDEIQIAVRDTGIGIAAEDLDHIFEEFRQADGSAARRFGGTGLGLSIARKYARLLQGRITVESTPGQGSVFTFVLPLGLGPPVDTAPSAPAVASPASRPTRVVHGEAVTPTGQRILVVEDNPSAVIQVTDILAGSGYRVKAARNGHEALGLIREDRPDAVILDLMMPEMDGFAVLKAIRENEHGSRLPVLILTAKHVTREDLKFLIGNNIHQLIQKGDVGKHELLAAVAGMVAPVEEKPARPVPAPTDKPSTGKPMVLVVEDNPDNLKTPQNPSMPEKSGKR